MEVALAPFKEICEQFLRSPVGALFLLFGWASHEFNNINLLIGWEDIRDLTSIQNIVYVFKEVLLLDLSVSEQERSWVSFTTNLSHKLFYIFSPLLSSVLLLDLNLIDIKVRNF